VNIDLNDRTALLNYLRIALDGPGLSFEELDEIKHCFVTSMMTVAGYINARWEHGEIYKEEGRFYQEGSGPKRIRSRMHIYIDDSPDSRKVKQLLDENGIVYNETHFPENPNGLVLPTIYTKKKWTGLGEIKKYVALLVATKD